MRSACVVSRQTWTKLSRPCAREQTDEHERDAIERRRVPAARTPRRADSGRRAETPAPMPALSNSATDARRELPTVGPHARAAADAGRAAMEPCVCRDGAVAPAALAFVKLDGTSSHARICAERPRSSRAARRTRARNCAQQRGHGRVALRSAAPDPVVRRPFADVDDAVAVGVPSISDDVSDSPSPAATRTPARPGPASSGMIAAAPSARHGAVDRHRDEQQREVEQRVLVHATTPACRSRSARITRIDTPTQQQRAEQRAPTRDRRCRTRRTPPAAA